MQYDRSTQRHRSFVQDSFLPNSPIKSRLFGEKKWGTAPQDDLKKEKKPSKWSQGPNGSWIVPKTLDEVAKKPDPIVAETSQLPSSVVETERLENKVESLQKTQNVAPCVEQAEPDSPNDKTESVVSDPINVPPPPKKVHKKWQFGKKKCFVRPKHNKKNNAAAIQIQRIARGGWQRLQFRMALLRYKLDTRKERTEASKAKIKKRLEQRKAKYLAKMQAKAKQALEEETLESVAARDAQKIIAFLRQDNKKLREKNDKIHRAICELKIQNDRLQNANSETGDSFGILIDHAKQAKEANDKLNLVVPKYKESVDTVKAALDMKQQYCLTEHKIKVIYMKCVGNVVEKMEEESKEEDLIEEIVGYCLDIDDAACGDVLVREDCDGSDDQRSNEEASVDSDNYDAYAGVTAD